MNEKLIACKGNECNATLRQRISELMQRVHLIPEGLAEQHVSEMDDEEVHRRMRMYAKLGAEFSVAEDIGVGLGVAVGARPVGIRRSKDDSGRDGGTPAFAVDGRSPCVPPQGAEGVVSGVAVAVASRV